MDKIKEVEDKAYVLENRIYEVIKRIDEIVKIENEFNNSEIVKINLFKESSLSKSNVENLISKLNLLLELNS